MNCSTTDREQGWLKAVTVVSLLLNILLLFADLKSGNGFEVTEMVGHGKAVSRSDDTDLVVKRTPVEIESQRLRSNGEDQRAPEVGISVKNLFNHREHVRFDGSLSPHIMESLSLTPVQSETVQDIMRGALERLKATERKHILISKRGDATWYTIPPQRKKVVGIVSSLERDLSPIMGQAPAQAVATIFGLSRPVVTSAYGVAFRVEERDGSVYVYPSLTWPKELFRSPLPSRVKLPNDGVDTWDRAVHPMIRRYSYVFQ